MLGTRPDIAYVVTRMSQFSANPTKEHLNKALYICRYLIGTADYRLTYGKVDEGLIAFADSDWGANQHTQHSTLGYLVLLGGAAIS